MGTRIDSAVTKDLLSSIFAPSSPLHDGAALIQDGRIAAVGCILPLTLKADLPEGVGTRHRAAVGITEETDAVVIVVSEETGTISIVMAGEMLSGLDAPHLRVALREILGNERRELPTSEEIARPLEVADTGEARTPVRSDSNPILGRGASDGASTCKFAPGSTPARTRHCGDSLGARPRRFIDRARVRRSDRARGDQR
ncbi:MAG: DNA integrity scanning protein DisA nucleotide-binding domain protein [Deltaproteobacteria bacterium]|nr:DNA integrity scanning protein DisA nucleotide-binding domain protein [Deltaproteobacteria bacterium]